MPQKGTNLQKIEAICQSMCQKLGYELCDVGIEKEHTGRYLRIYLDHDNGISLDDCEKYHRAVQDKLENFDYDFLEVCSPGIDRPIKRQRDIDKAIGERVEVKLYKPFEGSKEFIGTLRAMDDQAVALDVGETAHQFPRETVAQVRFCPDLSGLLDEE